MASLSLPRVLQLKKNSLDAEREQFEKFQTLAIQKAINSIETPVKEKHVRSTIIGTFQEQSAITYWMVAIRLPLQDNRIVAWKFCHVTHKLLREGHPACLDDSQRHIGMIENLGKLWVHLREGYGRLVHLYTNLLVCKLKFHARNPRFPGNMQLTADELDAIAENDVNNYFQLCVELFDYLDDILSLQAAVFDSLGNARANSMTASGQCRLAALIPCAQDSSQIYDCNVRLLFRLHAALPADTLAGHRERFRQQFKKLSSFYKHASSLQYYRNLLTLPVLPSNPPNFLQQSDFGTYVTPVVSIPEPPPDEVDSVGSLIDTSDTLSQMTSPEPMEDFDTRPSPSPQPDPVIERDRLIEHLQNELKRMRTEVSQLVQERNTMLGSMREHCTRLESQLHAAQNELEEEKQKAEMLSVQAPEIKRKLTETEDKAKVQDEKFQKLKGAYTQLREEHIALIRQKAEVDKLSASLRAAAALHESAKTQLQQELNDRLKDVELLQQSASSSEEIEAYHNQISNLRLELEQSRQKELELNTVRASLEALEIEHKTAQTEQEDKINTISSELKEATETLERIKQEKEEKDTELSRVKEELIGLREKRGDEYKKVVEEKEAALKEVTELKQQYQLEKEELTQKTRESIDKLQLVIDDLQQKLIETENNFSIECRKLNEDLTNKRNEFDESLAKKDIEIKEALDKLNQLQLKLENTKINYEERIIETSADVDNLQQNLNELIEYKTANEVLVSGLIAERDDVRSKLEEMTSDKNKVDEELNNKIKELANLKYQLQELESNKNQEIKEINQLKEELQATVEKTKSEISVLKFMLDEKSAYGDKQKSESQNLYQKIIELETVINEKNKEITENNGKLDEITTNLEKLKVEHENEKKDGKYEITILQDRLQNVTASKDEIINNLKTMITEKDNQVISLSVESTKLSQEVAKLSELLEESQAELEIGKNELFTLQEEHENIVQRNETNLSLKNQELRSLHDEIIELKQIKVVLETERDKNNNEYVSEKQVLKSKIVELNDEVIKLKAEYDTYRTEKVGLVALLNEEINDIKSKYEQAKETKNYELQLLKEQLLNQETTFKNDITAKDEAISKVEAEFVQLKTEIEQLQKLQAKEKEEVESIMSMKYKEKQILEARLEHTEERKLNAECELQDLLQHNTVLEADLAAVKIQLEEARKKIDEQNTRLVTCAGEAALEVTNDALSALERSNAQESNKAAAELAAKALEQLARCTEVKGNEECIAKSAILIAHNTAQLSSYVTEVSHISTDMELADKLNNECRSMLTATKECLESLKKGELSSTCTDTRGKVRSVAHAAAAADTANAGPQSVDDELADMDNAIEEAASQIENMLAASRASDSGIQLEVNEQILDTCTTLMGAVKVLVQDARRLQNELGDPKTRQKMYRKNPQWSEGLISAAKAVVFAAKLLVSSADEAVGAAGRVEGVSAAAHEVAGSTAQLVAASRARAPPAAPALARLTHASRAVAAATGAVLAAARAAAARRADREALDTSALTLTATRRLEMESKVRSLELESALDAERARLAALRKRHYQLAQLEENGNVTNGKE